MTEALPGSVPVVPEDEPLELDELDDPPEELLEELLDDDDAPEDDEAPEEDDELLEPEDEPLDDDEELEELDVELLVELDIVEPDEPEPPPQADNSIERNTIPDENRAAVETFLHGPAARCWVAAKSLIEIPLNLPVLLVDVSVAS